MEMKINSEDSKKIVKCGLVAFCDQAFYLVTGIFTTTYFLANYPAQWLAYLYIMQAITSIITFIALNQFLEKSRKKNSELFLLILVWVLIAIAVILAASTSLNEKFYWLPFIVCLVINASYRIDSNINSNTISGTLTFAQFKQNITLFNFIRPCADIILGLTIYFSATTWGAHGILILMILIITVNLWVTYRLPYLQMPTKQLKSQGTPFSHPHFVMLAIFMCCIGFLNTPSDYVFKYSLAQKFDQVHMSAFLGLFSTSVDVIWLILTAFISKRVLDNFGLKGCLAIMPIAYGISVLLVLINMNVVTTSILNAVCSSCYSCFHSVGYELGINVLIKSLREKGKLYIRIFLFATSLAAGLIICVMNYFHLPPQALLLLTLLNCLYGLFILKKISATYLNELANAVTFKRYSPPLLDLQGSSNELMNHAFASTVIKEDPEILEYALSVFPKTITEAPQQLLNYLHSKNKQVRLLVAQYFVDNRINNSENDLYEQLKDEKDPDVLGYLFEGMAMLNAKRAMPVALNYITAAEPGILSGVLPILIEEGPYEAKTAASKKLNLLIESHDVKGGISACRAISLQHTGNFYPQLKHLIQDDSPEVQARAFEVVLEKKEQSLLPEITAGLLNHNLSRKATKVLIQFGEISINYVKPLLYSQMWKGKAHATNVLAGIDSTMAQKALMEFYDSASQLLQCHIAKMIAYATIKRHVSISIKNEAHRRILDEFSLMENLEKAYKAFEEAAIRYEIDLRMQLTLKRCLYWIASYSMDSKVLELMPSLITKNKTPEAENNRAITLELLNNLIDDIAIKNKLRSLEKIQNYTITSEKPAVILEFADPWLNTLFKNSGNIKQSKPIDDTFGRALELRKSQLFENLQAEHLMHIIKEGTIVEIEENTTLFKQGDPCDGFYILLTGQVKIVLAPHETVLSIMKEYDFFGELGLLNDSVRRSSTATTVTPCTVYYFSKDKFNSLLQDIPQLLQTFIRIMIEYLRRNMEIIAP